MRIESWQIEAFGPLADWEETDLARHDLLIVLGANESGKSTLFEFLTSVLFGFSPARAQDHPYRPWSGRFPAGTVDVVLADRRIAHIARRLTSQAAGRLTIDGTEDDLANRPVPWVGLLSRPVFKNVHALTQDEALGLDQRAWQAVQDRVLGGSSYDFLRPSREVVDDLESQRTQYWRPDRRGKPEDRQIRDRIRELRRELVPAQDRRTRIEAINADLKSIEKRLHEQEGELHRIELALERDAVLAPLLRSVDRVRDLERKATALVASDELSADIAVERSNLSVMCSDLPDEIGRLEGEIEDREKLQKLEDSEIRLIKHREWIERLDRTAARAEADEDRVQRMDASIQRSEGSLQELAERTLADGQLSEPIRQSLVQISVVELRGRHREWNDKHRKAVDAAGALAEAKRIRLQQESEMGETESDRRDLDERLQALRQIQLSIATRTPTGALLMPAMTWILAAGVFAGLVAIVVGLILGGALGVGLTVVGVVLGVVLALVLAGYRRARRPSSASAAPTAPTEDLQRLGIEAGADLDAEIAGTLAARDDALRQEGLKALHERAEKDETDAEELAANLETASGEARSSFLSLVTAVPLAPIHRETPDDTLVRDLESIRRVVEDGRKLQENRDEVQQHLNDWRANIETLRVELAVELSGDPFDAVSIARRQLEVALRAQQEAHSAAAEIPEIKSILVATRDLLVASEASLGKINAGLAALDPDGGDPSRGLERLERARELRAESTRARSELDRDTPEWEERVAEAEELIESGEVIGLRDDERVTIRRQRETTRSQSQDLADERGSLRTEREALTEIPGPAHIAGEIAAAEDELTFVRREHDRLALVQQVIRLAEQRYREQYQSPLLSSAGTYLERFTDGRYDLLTVDDADPSDVQLQVRRSSAEFPEPVAPPLSRGTIQQVYFALRLAMVEQVEGEEPLPLFLDEMFVNWDPDRTASGLKALAHMTEDRQVLLFTADPAWAERASTEVGAHIVRTPGPAS